MKKYLASGLFILVIGSVSIAQKPMKTKMIQAEKVEAYKAELNLSEDQMKQIRAIRSEYKTEYTSEERARLTPEERENIKAGKAEERQKIQAVLTQEQKAKMQELRQEERQKRATNRQQPSPAPAAH